MGTDYPVKSHSIPPLEPKEGDWRHASHIIEAPHSKHLMMHAYSDLQVRGSVRQSHMDYTLHNTCPACGL